MPKKKKKTQDAGTTRPPKSKADPPTQELSFVTTVPQVLALQLWNIRNNWNQAGSGWTWIRPTLMKVDLARIKATTRPRVPELMEIGRKIFASTPAITLKASSIKPNSTEQKLELILEGDQDLRDLQLRLGQAVILGGFSLEEKGLPAPRALLARREEDREPLLSKPTPEMMTPPFDSWVVSRAHLIEPLQSGLLDAYTSLNVWKLAKPQTKSDWW